MRQIVICIVLCFLSSNILSNTVNLFEIKNYSRSIQVDGLLLEWKASSAKQIDSIYVDASITPKYLNGYIRFACKDEDSLTSILLKSSFSDFSKQVYLDSAIQAIDVALEIIQNAEEQKDAVLEWQFPIKELSVDSLNNLALSIELLSNNGEVKKHLLISGNVFENNNIDKGRNLPIQIVLIIVLFIIFAVMKKKAKKKYSN